MTKNSMGLWRAAFGGARRCPARRRFRTSPEAGRGRPPNRGLLRGGNLHLARRRLNPDVGRLQGFRAPAVAGVLVVEMDVAALLLPGEDGERLLQLVVQRPHLDLAVDGLDL